MNVNIERMRTTYAAFKEETARVREYAELRLCPIQKWGPHEYAVVYQPEFQEGPQQVTVVDVGEIDGWLDTAREDGRRSSEILGKVARFSGNWPDMHKTGKNEGWAVVIIPDEGHCAILLEKGGDLWADFGELMVRVVPGTEKDAADLSDRLDEELQNADLGLGL